MSNDATVVLRLSRAEAEWLSVIVDTPSVWDHANRVLAALKAALAAPAADAGTGEIEIVEDERIPEGMILTSDGHSLYIAYGGRITILTLDEVFARSEQDAVMSRAGSQADGGEITG